MIGFACPRCGNTQQVDDSLQGQKLPCPNCGQRLKVPPPTLAVPVARPGIAAVPSGPPPSKSTWSPSVSPSKPSTPAPPSAPGAGNSNRQWMYQLDGRQMGPVSVLELRRLAREGILKPEASVWTEGMAAWQAADKALPKLFAANADSAYDVVSAKARTWEAVALAVFCVLAGIAALIFVIAIIPKTHNEPVAKTDATPQTEKPSKLEEGGRTESDAENTHAAAVTGSGQLYRKALKSCVWILATDGKAVWTGSGALIDKENRLVITNQHVAEDNCTAIIVMFPAYRDDKQLIAERSYYEREIKNIGISAKIVRSNKTRDLAVIQLDKLPDGVVPMRLSKTSVVPEQSIYCIGGSPRGNEQGMWILSQGIVRQVYPLRWAYDDGYQREATIIASTLGTNQGDSGGPIYDADGKLVGVNAMGNTGTNQNVKHIDIQEVREFLPKCYSALGKSFRDAN